MDRKVYIELSLEVVKEPPYYVANCVELGVSSFGSSVDEAVERVKEAVLLYLDGITEHGECEDILREAGVRIQRRDTILDCPPSALHRAFFPLECAFA